MSSRKLFSIFSNSYTITFSSFDHTIPVPNNSLIDYPVKRYDRAFELASDVINENFTASNFLISQGDRGVNIY
jgi:hypothetical protein